MIMSKAKAILNPELVKSIRSSFPVVRKRSAFWFFNNECRNDLIETSPISSAILQLPPPKRLPDPGDADKQAKFPRRKASHNSILQMWRNMDPESKRKYFNMAEFDEVRYKEQKSLWISEVGALLQKHRDIERAVEMAPTHEELQSGFLVSLERLHRNYEQMIQTESTKQIYKDAISRVDINSMNSDEIISSVPKHHKAILTKPRRPPGAFLLYLQDNMARYREIRRQNKTNDSCIRLCASEWAELDSGTRLSYENRYSKLKEEYDKAMEQYKAEIQGTSENFLQEACREKKAFRRSLRKRLRDSSLLPLSIRNAFNFFLMDHRDSKLKDAIDSWRNLSQEEKQKYIKMNEDDTIRYKRELEAANEIKRMLSAIISDKKSTSTCD